MRRSFLALALLAVTTTAAAAAPEAAWTHQFGTSSEDSVNAVSAKGSDFYAVGATKGTLPEESSRGKRDAFIRRYDASGNIVWTDQFGTAHKDSALGVDASPAGIYVVGYADQDHLGEEAFVKGYDEAGNELWSDQFLRQQSSTATDVEVTSSGIFVVGHSFNFEYDSKGFVRRYDLSGKVIWTRVFGAGDYNEDPAVATGSSGIYVTGMTNGAMVRGKKVGSNDVFVRRYNGSGKIIWTRQFGSRGSDGANDVAAVSSGIYVAGSTSGTLKGQNASGKGHAFIRRYDPTGKVGWTRQFGTSGFEWVEQVAATSSGIYVAGSTDGEFRGQVSAGGSDAFTRHLDNSGTHIWTRQFGTSGFDLAWGADVASSGIYLGGQTDGSFPAQANLGATDAFVTHWP